jgi:hypothetical protein
MSHLDENGEPCTRHPPLPEPRLYELATLGSRMSGFHHDAASKLQSLVMALDDLGETASSVPPELVSTIETARAALAELSSLFAANRVFAKGVLRTRIEYKELLARASARVGVKLNGELPVCDLRVTVPALTHALALLIDVAACGSHAKRFVAIESSVGPANVVLTIAGPADGKPPPHADESIAIAAFVIARDEGVLRCGGRGQRFTLELAVATPTTAISPLPKP